MQTQVITKITTPKEAVDALALAAHTARQIFCIDEPPLPTLLCEMTWSAEEIARTSGLPESAMDSYRRTVFSEHPTDAASLRARELRHTQAALLDYVRQNLPDEPDAPQKRLVKGIAEWDELLEAVRE